MAAININALVSQMVAEATKIGGGTWTAIQKSAPLYFKGYIQTLANIAIGVKNGGISKSDAKIYVKNAYMLLLQGITHVTHVLLFSLQQFMDAVIAALKTTINGALPVKLL